MWLPLLFFALHAAPAVDPAQLMRRDLEDLKRRVRDEVHLLNQQLPLPPLDVWDPSGKWRSSLDNEKPPRSRLRVVHLWADYCTPCLQEFPQLKAIVEKSGRTFGRDELQFIFISESIETPAMKAFMDKNSKLLPPGAMYGDAGFALRDDILRMLPPYLLSGSRQDRGTAGRGLPLPLTVVLDENDVVRLAFVGALEGRVGDLMNGVSQLNQVAKARGGAGDIPPPPRGKVVAGRPKEAAR